MSDTIRVQGARQHNLKNVSLAIPRHTFTVFTGVSGSGKSSLARDTIFQEGQRRYVESLSAYARQFLGELDRPDVDSIEGLSPAISIDQRSAGSNPRSTVGTVTEVYSLLRLLYARLGVPHCPKCGREIARQTPERIALALLARHAGENCLVMATLVHERKGEYRRELEELRSQGYVRVRVDGVVRRLDEKIELARYERHTIEVVLDRIVLAEKDRNRVLESVERAVALAAGKVSFLVTDDSGKETHEIHSTERACPDCGVAIPELAPALFSFNSPIGACPKCNGLGECRQFSLSKIVPDPALSVNEGALAPLATGSGNVAFTDFGPVEIDALAEKFKIDLDRPWKELAARERNVLLEGSGDTKIAYEWEEEGPDGPVEGRANRTLPGVLSILRESYDRWHIPYYEKFMRRQVCPACSGKRLVPEALAVRFKSRAIDELSALPIRDAHAFFQETELSGNEALIGREIFKEIVHRLSFLDGLGLGYLALDRRAGTLAGGEMQRIRLARQLGSGLQGVIYILDEPSVGLHARDNDRLIRALLDLRDQGNTVFVIEHDEETMRAADHLVDIGPGAGREGGEIVAQGPPGKVARSRASLTAAYLRGDRSIPLPERRRAPGTDWIVVEGAAHHNLKEIDVAFPLGLFIAVTGVSGSGKSTLVDLVLRRALEKRLYGSGPEPGKHARITGAGLVDKVIEIDQSPIGRTPRSNPATYVKAFDLIRDLFAEMPLSKVRGYPKGRFSFNKEGGRCEACEGAGVKRIEMQFFAPVEVACDECQGLRYTPETLEVKFRGKDIHEVLEMTVSEALGFFANQPKIHGILDTMDQVGLGYVALGQPSTTLSGGEAQRIKLVRELRRPATGRTFYILDEPTTGLHFDDIQKLLDCLQRLVDRGNTVLVIEHNLDVVKVADHVIDLGPEGGDEGGRVVYAGPFDGILDSAGSHTGRALAGHLGTARTRNGKRGARSAKAGGRARRPPRKPGGDLVLRGATKNNLKNLDARIPARSLTVVTGVSGSGKTSLVLDTIFTEGQRRFVESLSTYARRFLGRLERSPVDSIEGLSPAIAIDQRAAPPNPRSTVATATEIYDALRLLYARIGRPHCPGCGKPLSAFSPSQAARDLIERHAGARGRLLAPLFLGTENKHVQTPFASPEDLLRARESLVADGCLRVLVDGRELRLDSELAGARMRDPEHGGLDQAREIHLVVDRVDLAEKSLGRLAEGFEAAYRRTEGLAFFELEGGARLGYSRRPGCVECHHYQRGEPTPRLFSFNHHSGACPGCEGIGERMEVVAQEVVRKPDRPLLSALAGPVARLFAYRGGCQRAALEGLASHLGIDLDDPFEDLPARARKVLLEGLPGQSLAVERTKQGGSGERTFSYEAEWPGILALARRLYERHAGTSRAADLEGIFSWAPCSECGGQRLNPEARAFLVGGRSIAQVARLAVGEATSFFAGLVLDTREKRIARQVVDEIRNRLEFLASVGLHYLSLDRKCGTLTGGEAQRIRLATQLGSRLAGVLYCLDEPTIGLHARDTERLLATLEGMRDLGNTVVVIEHDEGVIRRADHVLDVGPGAGHKGGEIVAAGTPGRISRSSRSLTGRFLSGRRSIPTPAARRPAGENGWITVRGARANNLRSIDASFPLGSLVAVTGVSGSGKSSLVLDCLVAGVRARQEWRLENGPRPGVRGGDADFPDNHDDIEGLNVVSGVVLVDQQPIGRSPKSNPATYSGAFDEIRALFASLPASRAKGFLPARFSFNLAGGRCEACEGRGQILVEMHFLSDVWVTCEDCGGKRFNQETLSVRFKGLTISDVLGLEICEAIQFFGAQPAIVRPLKVLESVGLGYLRLGQSATTLSGGEAQRLKLATELARRSTGRTLYVLDEPTTGLHLADVEVLLEVLHRLVDRGHTVVVVEHHLDVVKNADWVIDLGPEGGEAGGEIVFAGRPEDLARCPTSHTGRFLAAKLARAVSGTL